LITAGAFELLEDLFAMWDDQSPRLSSALAYELLVLSVEHCSDDERVVDSCWPLLLEHLDVDTEYTESVRSLAQLGLNRLHHRDLIWRALLPCLCDRLALFSSQDALQMVSACPVECVVEAVYKSCLSLAACSSAELLACISGLPASASRAVVVLLDFCKAAAASLSAKELFGFLSLREHHSALVFTMCNLPHAADATAAELFSAISAQLGAPFVRWCSESVFDEQDVDVYNVEDSRIDKIMGPLLNCAPSACR
jgi:hypothetical protein